MSLKYRYWTGMNVWTTSNSQMTSGQFHQAVSATRLQTDTYVRSIWWLTYSYMSDGSQAQPPGWWSAATVHFVANVVTNGSLGAIADIGTGEPPGRVAFAGLRPRRDRTDDITGAPTYSVVWEGPPDGLITHTSRRKGDGVNFPAVVAQFTAHDQNGFLAGVAEPGYLLRCTILGRVLWESDAP